MNLTAITQETERGASPLGGEAEIDCSGPPTGRRVPESAATYPAIAVLDAKTRVIECAAGIQWIVQRQGGQQWHGRHFCRTKEALLRRAAREVAGADRRPELVSKRSLEKVPMELLTSPKLEIGF
jgi:hypothetical protein